MEPPHQGLEGRRVVLGLSGGVDSAVAAILLKNRGAEVQALHMTNWEDDEGYCTAAEDLQDARRICERLGVTLHHVNFSLEYRHHVFANFLEEYRAGRTPNPDVLCNREIKFGVFIKYAERLGGELIATGHYARTRNTDGRCELLKASDLQKDQSYFLHAVNADALSKTIFPLGEIQKSEVRRIARNHGLEVHDKKDSTGICFIGERPFREFLSTYLPTNPGSMLTPEGKHVADHAGLAYYTIGQRQGLGIGGRHDASDEPWYVVDKDLGQNALIVVQGNHPLRYKSTLEADKATWINGMPEALVAGKAFKCTAKIRYRQQDQRCTVTTEGEQLLRVRFDQPQCAVSPGQFVVFYNDQHCLGGAVIRSAASQSGALRKVG